MSLTLKPRFAVGDRLSRRRFEFAHLGNTSPGIPKHGIGAVYTTSVRLLGIAETAGARSAGNAIFLRPVVRVAVADHLGALKDALAILCRRRRKKIVGVLCELYVLVSPCHGIVTGSRLAHTRNSAKMFIHTLYTIYRLSPLAQRVHPPKPMTVGRTASTSNAVSLSLNGLRLNVAMA